MPDSLHILQKHLLAAAVIEFRSVAVGMASNPLRALKGAAIFHEARDTGHPSFGAQRKLPRQTKFANSSLGEAFDPTFMERIFLVVIDRDRPER
jgi:hypothetical protein